MKVIGVQETDLVKCVREARRARVILTRKGKPVAVVVSVEGLDLEQVQLGHSDKFWDLIRKRRRQRTISRKELEKRLAD